MSKDVLEAAFQKTKDIEKKKETRMKIAEAFGKVTGYLASVAIDATVIWAILVWMVGLSVGWLQVAGGVILLQILRFKTKA